MISVYILAGGESRRMGENKGLKDFKGQRMIECLLQVLDELGLPAPCLIANHPEYWQLGLETLPDHWKGYGPLGGICTALNHSKERLNLILPCDMPFLDATLLKDLLEKADPGKHTVLRYKGKLQPLVGVYDRLYLAGMLGNLEAEALKMQNVLENFPLKTFELLENKENDRRLMNLNRPEEWEEAEKSV